MSSSANPPAVTGNVTIFQIQKLRRDLTDLFSDYWALKGEFRDSLLVAAFASPDWLSLDTRARLLEERMAGRVYLGMPPIQQHITEYQALEHTRMAIWNQVFGLRAQFTAAAPVPAQVAPNINVAPPPPPPLQSRRSTTSRRRESGRLRSSSEIPSRRSESPYFPNLVCSPRRATNLHLDLSLTGQVREPMDASDLELETPTAGEGLRRSSRTNVPLPRTVAAERIAHTRPRKHGVVRETPQEIWEERFGGGSGSRRPSGRGAEYLEQEENRHKRLRLASDNRNAEVMNEGGKDQNAEMRDASEYKP